MDLIEKVFGVRKKSLGLPKQYAWNLVGGMWIPYDSSDALYIDKAFKAIPIIQAIVSELIDKASDAPPQVMRVKDEKAAKQYFLATKNMSSPDSKSMIKALRVKAFDQLVDHPVLDVFENPNPYMTGKDLRESSMGYLLITGNSIEYNATVVAGPRKGSPRQIWSIPSPCVRPVFGESRLNPLTGYSISYVTDAPIPFSEITHVKYFNPIVSTSALQEQFWGLSPLRSARKIISQKEAADIAQGSLFRNMSPAGMIVGNGSEGYGELDDEQSLVINEHFRKSHMGVHNAGDIMVTPANIRWEQIGLSPVDLQIIDWNKDIERQIARLYRYPDEMLESGGVVANSEVGALKLIRNAVYPIISRYDQSRTKKLREWYKDDSLVYLSDLDYYPELQPNKKDLAAWMRNAGVFTQQEIRRAFDYEEGFDESQVLIPTNLMPLSDMRGLHQPTAQNEPKKIN